MGCIWSEEAAADVVILLSLRHVHLILFGALGRGDSAIQKTVAADVPAASFLINSFTQVDSVQQGSNCPLQQFDGVEPFVVTLSATGLSILLLHPNSVLGDATAMQLETSPHRKQRRLRLLQHGAVCCQHRQLLPARLLTGRMQNIRNPLWRRVLASAHAG